MNTTLYIKNKMNIFCIIIINMSQNLAVFPYKFFHLIVLYSQKVFLKELALPFTTHTRAQSQEREKKKKMEFYDENFMEELMALRRETYEITNPSQEENQFFSSTTTNSLSFDNCFDQNSLSYLPNSSCSQQLPQSYINNDHYSNTFNEIYGSLLDESSTPQIFDSYYNSTTDAPFISQEDFPLSMMGEEEDQSLLGEELQNLELQTTCKMEPTQSPEMPIVFNTGTSLERKNRAKKLQGQPSKNLMAERRRRKRLNDRLSMLRAIVPKISKVSTYAYFF
jgi:hypothetical protein